MDARVRAIGGALFVFATTCVVFVSTAFTQDGTAERLAAEGFVPAPPGSATENIDGLPLMVAAYVVIWVLLMGYVAMLMRRHGAVARELDSLRIRMQELDERLAEVEGDAGART